MKIKIDRQLRILAAMKDRVKDQVVEMQRLEVRRNDKKDKRTCLHLLKVRVQRTLLKLRMKGVRVSG